MGLLTMVTMLFTGCGENGGDSESTSATKKLTAFNLVSPAKNETTSSQTEFSWEASENAMYYKFQISGKSDFSSLDFQKIINCTSYNIETILDGNRVYYWRVVAIGEENRTRIATNSPYIITTEYRYLSVSADFRDNMVVQRNSTVNVWGYAKKNTSVSVDFAGNKKESVSGADGYYCVSFNPMAASSDPHTLTISSAGETLTVGNVVIGDVILAAGQSNVQWVLKDSDYLESDLVMKNRANLRLFSQSDNPETAEQSQVKGGYWFIPDTYTELDYSALSYLIGYMLEEYNPEIPVGIIFAAKGDTHIQQWMSKDSFSENWTSVNNGYGGNVYYNGMINPLTKNSLTAVFWYQGENNAWDSTTYKDYLLSFASDMRSKFSSPKLPFFIVQLPKYNTDILQNMWAQFRLVQAEACSADENMHLIVTYDGGDVKAIHPAQKKYIAQRFLLSYRKYVLLENITADSPALIKVEINGSEMILTFGNSDGLYSDGTITGFEVAGNNNSYKNATAVITDGNKITVSCGSISLPVHVRYCFENAPAVNVFNSANLPLAPFRY